MSAPVFDMFKLSYLIYQASGGGVYGDSADPDKPLMRFEPGLPPVEFYDQWLSMMAEQDLATQYHYTFGFQIERKWYATGCPEFRVYPGIIDALENTKIDVPASFFKMPFSTFMLRFPHHYTREDENSPWVQAVLVTTIEEPPLSKYRTVPDGKGGKLRVSLTRSNDPPIRKLVIFVCFDAKEPDCYNYMKFGIPDGQSIEECFASALLRSEDADPDAYESSGYWPGRKLYRKVLAVALGTALFATGASKQKLVEQVRLPRHERRRIAKEKGGKTRKIEAPIFDVGRVLSLPRSEVEPGVYEPAASMACAACSHAFEVHGRGKCPVEGCICSGFDTGRHLTHAHPRVGHWHFYCTGKRGIGPNDYVIRWLAPIIVRPELPLAPSKAYAIKPPKRELVELDPQQIEER